MTFLDLRHWFDRLQAGKQPAVRIGVSNSEPGDDFRGLSEEYAQALEAFKAIVLQTDALMLMGAGEQLSGFLDQFSAMAAGASERAREKGLSQFVEWFDELGVMAEDLRRKHLPSGARAN